MPATYALTGGLDLSTNKVSVNPGTLADALNYEVSDVDGYTRISGFERFDGQFRVAETMPARLYGTMDTGTFNVGDPIRFNGGAGYITSTSIVGTDMVVCVLMDTTHPMPQSLPAALTHASLPTAGTVTTVELLQYPVGRQSAINQARSQLAAALRPKVGMVPGSPSTPVSCVFWYKNRLHAVRDYPVVWFESATPRPFVVGTYVTLVGGTYQVIDLRYSSSANLAGYLVLWPVDRTGKPIHTAPKPGDAIMSSGAYLGADLGGAAVGEMPLCVLGEVSFGDSNAVVTDAASDTQDDDDDLSLRAYRTPAALWKATASGWQAVDLKREAQFKAGTADFDTFIQANVGIGAQTALASGFAAGSSALFNGADVTTDVATVDATDADLSGAASDELVVTGIDLSAIPDTATILGIEVKITRHADAGGKARDEVVELVGLDGPTNNKARMTAWDTSPTAVTYGGDADVWGNGNITAAAVKSASFGVHLVTAAIDTTPVGGIDAVEVNVHYRRRDAAVFVWDGTNDTPLNLIDVQLVSGAYTDGDAAGWLVVDIPGSGLTSSISNDMELRTAAAGGGDLLATIASTDLPIRMPGWTDLKDNQSLYRTIVENFYGQAEYEAVYGVTGASPAWTYDGTRLLWMRTPLSPQQDLPRHIARHGGALVLGYLPGAYILSVVGSPTNFRGEDGAKSIEIGERLTNLMPAMGDALLVTSQTKTKVLHGLTPEAYQQDTVSDKRGAMEYTGADVGRLLVTDTFGIAAADATQAFGDLSRIYVSMRVRSWLAQRLNARAAAGTRPICAMSVANRNQYRLYFQDGYVLTLTANDAMEFTIQRYFAPGTPGKPDVPFPVTSVTTGIDGDGRERVFGTFDADANRGYVFELDHGNTFDGKPIPAFVELNPLSFGDNAMLKRFEHALVFGTVGGFANLKLSRAIGFDSPDGLVASSFTLGDPQAMAGKRHAARGNVDAPIEGYEVAFRIDSLTDTESPHTLQAISTDFDPRGETRGHVRG